MRDQYVCGLLAARDFSREAVPSTCPSVFFVSIERTRDYHPSKSTSPPAHPSVNETVAWRNETVSMLEVPAKYPRCIRPQYDFLWASSWRTLVRGNGRARAVVDTPHDINGPRAISIHEIVVVIGLLTVYLWWHEVDRP